jgi:hypothetical protein
MCLIIIRGTRISCLEFRKISLAFSVWKTVNILKISMATRLISLNIPDLINIAKKTGKIQKVSKGGKVYSDR